MYELDLWANVQGKAKKQEYNITTKGLLPSTGVIGSG